MNPALADVEVTEPGTPGIVPAARGTPAARAPGAGPPSFWQWPHLLSLDAPLVALVWQRWWACSAGVTLPTTREWILALGVWLIYLADRLADAADRRDDGAGSARHVFSGRHRRVLVPMAGGVAVALTILAARDLPRAELLPGLVLLTLAAAYFWLIHGRPETGWAAHLPKEAVVGAMFSAGTMFFVALRAPHVPPACWAAGVLFAGVCFLNCALITTWERQARDVRERSSLLNAFPRFSTRLRAGCVVLAGVTVAWAAASASWPALPVAASALLLANLDGLKTRISADTLRILADVSLFSPLCGLLAWPA